jgi:hypothetical protein
MATALDRPLGRTRLRNGALQEVDLPLDLTRKIAAVFSQWLSLPRMKLAGLNEEKPSRKAGLSKRPAPIQFVPLQVALPSEGALRDMFHSLLAWFPRVHREPKPLKF